jgi:hypothetical protein
MNWHYFFIVEELVIDFEVMVWKGRSGKKNHRRAATRLKVQPRQPTTIHCSHSAETKTTGFLSINKL